MPAEYCPSPQDPRGCFLLSHDKPNPAIANYNTSSQLLTLLSEPTLRYWTMVSSKFGLSPFNRLLATAQRPAGVYIALCFKLDGFDPCDGSERAQNWTALADEFFERANEIVKTWQLNVHFILDGGTHCQAGNGTVFLASCHCMQARRPRGNAWRSGGARG